MGEGRAWGAVRAGHLAERDLRVALQKESPRARKVAVHLEDPVADRERLHWACSDADALAADARSG